MNAAEVSKEFGKGMRQLQLNMNAAEVSKEFGKGMRRLQLNIRRARIEMLFMMHRSHELRMKNLPPHSREVHLSVCDAIKEMP